MTLEQKVGQMTQADIRSVTPEEAQAYYLGSILNGGGAWPDMNKHASVADWVDLARKFDAAALASDALHPVPLIWGTDAVHGHNNVYGATIFPHNIGLGAAHDPDLVERIGKATARQVRATGIAWAFAPTLAVVQNQRWGRSYESYSSDAAQVAANGAALVRGLQGGLANGEGVIATAKHYVGDGGTLGGVDQGETHVSATELANVHGAGYYAALDAGVDTVMVSYSSWTETGKTRELPFGKMHGDRALVTGVLRGPLGFDGLTVSDWNAIEQVPGCAIDHCPQAINAGIDMIMVPDKWKSFIANTVADVRAGRISMDRIDQAVTRILRVKDRAGLFDKPTTAARLTGDQTVLAARDLAKEAVRKSAVLLKNDGVLPLAPGGKVLVVGAAADSFPQQVGGWSMTWQGDNIDNADFPVGETLLAGLRRVFGTANVAYSPDGAGIDPSRFAAVIAVLGEAPYAETKGDVRWPKPLAFSPRYPDQSGLLARVSAKGIPVVTVLYSGRTEYTTDLINRSDAFVAAFLPGTEAGALADLLSGRSQQNFTGRLSFAWPNTPCPSDGYPPSEALFMRGYGLGYHTARSASRFTESAIPVSCP